MTDEPRVTIGVPVFNGGRYLEASLRSVADQSLRDFEVVILDNASTDETEAIAHRFVAEDRRFRYFRNPRNIGLAANFGALVPLARGSLFKWLAADDLLRPRFLERCVAELDADLGLALATTRLEVIGEDAEQLLFDGGRGVFVATNGEVVIPRTSIAAQLGDPDPVVRFSAALRGLLGIQISTYIFGVMRTDHLRSTRLLGGYPGSDKVLLAELLLRGRFAESAETEWQCRIHARHVGGLGPAELSSALRPDGQFGFTTMRLSQLLGYASAVRRAPLGMAEKAGCLKAMSRRGFAAAGLGA